MGEEGEGEGVCQRISPLSEEALDPFYLKREREESKERVSGGMVGSPPPSRRLPRGDVPHKRGEEGINGEEIVEFRLG